MRADIAADMAEIDREKAAAPNVARLSSLAHEALNFTADPRKRARIEMLLLNLSLIPAGQDITPESVTAAERDVLR